MKYSGIILLAFILLSCSSTDSSRSDNPFDYYLIRNFAGYYQDSLYVTSIAYPKQNDFKSEVNDEKGFSIQRKPSLPYRISLYKNYKRNNSIASFNPEYDTLKLCETCSNFEKIMISHFKEYHPDLDIDDKFAVVEYTTGTGVIMSIGGPFFENTAPPLYLLYDIKQQKAEILFQGIAVRNYRKEGEYFPTSQRLTISVRDMKGKEIWSNYHGMDFLQVIGDVLPAAPGDYHIYEQKWNLKDNNGKKVSPGEYTAYINLNTSVENYSRTINFEIEDNE